MPDSLVLIFAGIFGSMIGSFLNVVIHRMPRRESLSWPGSRCPACGTPIHWHQNMPVLSWGMLLGRCRTCRTSISPRYLLVELLVAGLALAVAARFLLGGPERRWVLGFVVLGFVGAMIAGAFIDLAHRIIPDRITKPGMLLAPILAFLAPDLHHLSLLSGADLPPRVAALLLSLAGMAAGAGAIWGIGLLGRLAFRKEAMGFGDVKFMGMVGGFLGPIGVLLTILAACLLGSVIGTLSWAITKSRYIPFGPFLAAGALLILFFRDAVVHFVTVTYPSLF